MYLLDTNIIIDFCNSKLSEAAKNLLFSTIPTISVITSIELFSSNQITDREKLVLEEFVKIATVCDHINSNIVLKAIEIRRIYKTKLPDAIIAATAISYNLILLSRNTADFKKIEGLQLIDLYNI